MESRMFSTEDAKGNYLAFETLPNDQMHLYYDCAGRKFELVGPTVKLLSHLRNALMELDLDTLKN